MASIVATGLFHIGAEAATYRQTGSGDTTLQYVRVFLSFVAALSGTAIWPRLLIRYFMALMSMGYGYSKVFMGASAAYTIFGGVAEVTGGSLLRLCRTTALGALVTFGVMTNIVALNYCYDIPVKLHSTHYLLMSAFLLAPDFHRLVNVFLLNRRAEPADLRVPAFRTGWPLWASRRVWAIVIAIGVIANGVGGNKKFAAPKSRPPLYGLYAVESEMPDGWRSLAFDTPDSLTIHMRDGRSA